MKSLGRDSFKVADSNLEYLGHRINIDVLRELDLPHAWLNKEKFRSKRLKALPELLEVALDRPSKMLMLDDEPYAVVPDREIMQFSEMLKLVELNAEANFGKDDVTYSIKGDELAITAWGDRKTPISPRVGDVLQVGSRFVYKPARKLSASAMAKRLVCTNGMAREVEKHSWRGEHGIEKQKQFVVDVFARSYMEASHICMSAMLLHATPIPKGQDPIAFIRELCRLYGFGAAMTEEIVLAFNFDRDVDPNNPTQWDIANAFTRALTHSPETSPTHIELAGSMVVRSVDLTSTMVDARVPELIATIWGGRN